ncbi:MAG: hypothetical protein JNN18_15795 [Rubrivivax sp.]|nr:hypothetical protein [Rubrivivax sp.]
MRRRPSVVRRAFTGVLALVILFEEWGWEPLQELLGRLTRWRVVAAMERTIRRLPPWAALVLFAGVSVALLPVKLLALALIGRGHAALGLVVVIAAKVGGTAMMARLFALTRPALLRLPWFAALYTRWTAWKQAIVDQVRASWAWRAARQVKAELMRRLRRA